MCVPRHCRNRCECLDIKAFSMKKHIHASPWQLKSHDLLSAHNCLYLCVCVCVRIHGEPIMPISIRLPHSKSFNIATSQLGPVPLHSAQLSSCGERQFWDAELKGWTESRINQLPKHGAVMWANRWPFPLLIWELDSNSAEPELSNTTAMMCLH